MKWNQVNHIPWGFTLIEIVIVVAIIAILAAIALPSYRDYIVQSRRTDVQAALLEISQYMERQYASSNSYPSSIPSTLTARTSAYYAVTLATGSGAQAYVVQAVPTGGQADSKCGTLSVSHTGAKSPSTAGCWK